jgi:hypothetical protein
MVCWFMDKRKALAIGRNCPGFSPVPSLIFYDFILNYIFLLNMSLAESRLV